MPAPISSGGQQNAVTLDKLEKENMSCYFRHMKALLDEAGVVVTAENKREIDRIIHEFVGATYKDCPTAWRGVKEKVLGDPARRSELVGRLRSASEP